MYVEGLRTNCIDCWGSSQLCLKRKLGEFHLPCLLHYSRYPRWRIAPFAMGLAARTHRSLLVGTDRRKDLF